MKSDEPAERASDPNQEGEFTEEELLRRLGDSPCASRRAVENETLDEYLARTIRE